MQHRLVRYVLSLAVGLFSAFLVALFPLVHSANAVGPDAAGNDTVLRHVKSMTHPARGAYFPAAITGTHYVYVNNGSTPNSISGYSLTSSGMTPLPGSPYKTGGSDGGYGYGGNQLAISPDHLCVFASDDSSGTFNSFLINADHSLTLVTHAVVEASSVQAVAVSPLGGVVFVAIYKGYSHGLVDSFSIGTGCIISETQSTDIGSAISSVVVSHDGSKLFVSSYIGGFINAYAISGTSFTLLTSNTVNPSSPGGLIMTEKRLVSGSVVNNSETSAYTFDTNGVLTTLPGSPATDAQGSNSVQVWFDHADRQFICSEQFSNSFGLFAVVNGTYTFLAHVAGTGNVPTAMAEVGHELMVTNDGSGSISVYTAAHGSLTYQTSISLPAAGNPNGIAAF